MARKPTYEELEQRIRELEKESVERNRAEEAMRKSEERFRSLVETTSDWIWETDAEGKYTYTSPRVRDLLGYEPEEVIGRTPFDLIAQDERGHLATAFARINEERRPFFNFENTNLHKDGHPVVLETSGVPRLGLHGNFLGYRGVDRDITERKRAEETLRESEERFRKLFEYHSAVMMVIDPDTGNIIYANEAAANFYGWSIEELRDMRIQQINTLSSEAVKSEMEKARSSESTRFEFRHRRADGSIREVEVFSNKIEITGKALLYSIIHDITERKQAEEALEEERRRLQKALDDVRTLRGIVPICANCKKIRDDKGYWNQVEKYVSEHSEAEFSHGICPECLKKLYPEFAQEESQAKP
jgi:PAS domain S-box-containing protein